jgi:hypothetical protein
MPPIRPALEVAEYAIGRIAGEGALSSAGRLVGQYVDSMLGEGTAKAIGNVAGKLTGAETAAVPKVTDFMVTNPLGVTAGRATDLSKYEIFGATHTLKFSEGVTPLARTGSEILPGAGAAEQRFPFLYEQANQLYASRIGEGVEVFGRNTKTEGFTRLTEMLRDQVASPMAVSKIPTFGEYAVYRPLEMAKPPADLLGTVTHVTKGF